ncbi:ABC transporter substrate-binding protein [Geodermatophilus sabuli]|uniref:ABC transporter substrate-binding protein n=1 Tax=Geodermatophilus sabuli TaxID=1564158 RepID=UPI0019530AFC
MLTRHPRQTRWTPARQRRRGIALAGALALAVTGCGSSDDGTPSSGGAESLDAVTAGIVPVVDSAPIYLGQQQGFFEDPGIDLTLQSGQGGAAIVPGVVNGTFQFGFGNVTSVLLAADQGLPLEIVAGGVASTGEAGADFSGVVARPDSGIATAADLAGKRVAVNTLNNIGTTTINESVRKAGGDPASIQYVELPFADMPAALDQGNVDAVWVVEPFLTVAAGGGGRVVASNYVDAADDLTVAVYFTSAQLAADDPDLVDRFQAAMTQSLEYARQNPDATRAILTEYTDIEQSVLDSLQLPEWPTEINRDSIETLAELGVADGLLTRVPDLAQLLP